MNFSYIVCTYSKVPTKKPYCVYYCANSQQIVYTNSLFKKASPPGAWYMAQISTIAPCNSPWGMSYGAQSAHFHYTIPPWVYHMAHTQHISTIQSFLGYIIWRTIRTFPLYNPSLGISYGAQSAHIHYTILPWVYHMVHNPHISTIQSFLGYIIWRTISTCPVWNLS